jgi:sulfur dioxygenase
MIQNLIFHQLFEKETSSYTYLIADQISKEAIIIDPVVEMVDRDVTLIEELGLKLKYVLDTHVHADHVTASGELRKRTGAKVAISSAYDMACPDIHLQDGDELEFGPWSIKAMATPGHTGGCMTYQFQNMIFTGDALLVRGCGRTDFQEGSSEKLYQSVRGKLFCLPEDTIVYPAHDYKGFTKSSVGMEKQFNPRLRMDITKDEFVNIMASLKLAYPKKIQEAVPANMLCGLTLKSEVLNPGVINGIPTVTPEDVHLKLGHVKIIDVRGSDEFNNELGHIPSAELATLGSELENKLSNENPHHDIVFVCRSGKRSGEATKLALTKGFDKVYSLQGGMLRWHELQFPFEKDMGGS